MKTITTLAISSRNALKLVVALMVILPGIGGPALAQVDRERFDDPRSGQFIAQPSRNATPRKAVILGTLDKITGRVAELEAPLDQAVAFGTIEITSRACNSTPPEEPPETSAFLEVRDLRRGEEPVTVFTGWMFASSPALSAMEHAVYDVWVLRCKTLSPTPDSPVPNSDDPTPGDGNESSD